MNNEVKNPTNEKQCKKVMFLQMQLNHFEFHKEPFSEQFLVWRVF